MIEKNIELKQREQTQFRRDSDPMDMVLDPGTPTKSKQLEIAKPTNIFHSDCANSSSVAKALRGLALI